MFMKFVPVCVTFVMTVSVAHAETNLVLNGNFESTTAATKTQLGLTTVDNWSIANPGSLTYIDTPGTADNGAYLSVYRGFPKTDTLQGPGGNFIMADGDPKYAVGGLYQFITGLVIGQVYALTFDYAGSEQSGFKSPSGYTTEWWNVSLDTTRTQTATNTQQTAVLTTPNGSYSPWQAASMSFTAKATSEYLTFLAAGTPVGAPPISFLDNVQLQPVPEPMTLSLLGVGLLGTILLSRRRRAAPIT